MSNQEFENYVTIMAKMLQLRREQKDVIAGELRDHLQLRVEDLTQQGVEKDAAVKQALEEFGDAAIMAKNFQAVLDLKRKRWMMRFMTFSVAGVFGVAILAMAMWPESTRFGAPRNSVAQQKNHAADDAQTAPPVIAMSDATVRDQTAETALKRVLTFEYEEVPFADVLAELRNTTNLNFVLNTTAVDEGLGPDALVTVQLRELPLNQALAILLRNYNVTYVIRGGVVTLISLESESDPENLRVKLFDCRDLVAQLDPPRRNLSQILSGKLPLESNSLGGGGRFGGGERSGGGGGFGGGGQFQIPASKRQDSVKDDKSKPKQQDLEAAKQKWEQGLMTRLEQASKLTSEDTLINLVTQMVFPDSWDASSGGAGEGKIEVVNGILVVKNSEAVLIGVERLLGDLRGSLFNSPQATAAARVKLQKSADAQPAESLKEVEAKPESNSNPFEASESDDNPFGG